MKIGWLFKSYINVMASLGHAVQTARHVVPKPLVVDEPGAGSLTLAEADRQATALGNHFRALGIGIGLLGIAIVFLAIAPVGLDLEPHTAHVLGAIKVFLMVAMLLIVIMGRRSRTNRDWIRLRAKAEELRYSSLSNLIDQVASNSTMEVCVALRHQLISILDGPNGQIAYNAAKARQYHGIERFSDFLLWASVVLALVGAIGHLFAGLSWWIFLTAFGPAAVGGIHGINGFLGVGGLLEEHEATEHRLKHSLIQLQKLNSLDNGEPDELHKLAVEVFSVLTSRDARWKVSTEKLGLRPA